MTTSQETKQINGVEFCLYRHIRNDNEKPFYIGIASKPNRPFTRYNRNKWWHHVVNKHGYYVEIMLTGLTKEQACQKEQEFIKLYGRVTDGGILVNQSIGGDLPALGVRYSDEWKKMLSEKRTGAGNYMYGRKRPELKEMMKPYEEKRLEAVRQSNKERKSKPIVAVRISTNEEIEYPSQREASRSLGVDQSRIYLVLNNKALTSGGFTFKYK